MGCTSDLNDLRRRAFDRLKHEDSRLSRKRVSAMQVLMDGVMRHINKDKLAAIQKAVDKKIG